MTDSSTSHRASEAGRTLPALLALAVLAGLIGLGLQTFEASPDPLPADAPPEVFSAERALEHLQVIAQEPRPTGSAALARARDYLFSQLSALDLDPQVRRVRMLFPWPGVGALQYVTVENIVARLPGTGDGKAVMLVSHYDSVPSGPGAADDGAGVAAMLETARALRQGPGRGEGLTNDIIFLFTDAEELGLVGARAFVDSDPWLGDVGMVLNFEARGRGGAARMFRTSQDNGWLVDRLAETPAPVATSLSYEVFKYMPNDTDFTIFEGRGLPGMDFAFIDGFPSYHSELDTVEALDTASLQHHGSYMLSLVRSLGQADLNQARSQGDKVYFNPLGSWLVSYSGALALVLAVLAAALWVVSLVLARRRRRITTKSMLAGFFGGLLAAVVAAGGCFFLWQQAGGLDVDFRGFFPFGMGYELSVYSWGFGLVALGLTWLACRLLLPRDGVLGFALGSTLLWVLLTLVTTFLLPGVSYLFLWPSLFAFAFILWSALRPPSSEGQESGAEQRLMATALAAVAALPVLLLFPPLAALLFSALGLSLAPVLAVLLGLAVVQVAPLWAPVDRRFGFWVPLVITVVGAGIVLTAALTQVTGEDHPQRNTLIYSLDGEAGEARWWTYGRETDAWTAEYLGEEPESRNPGLLLSWTPDRDLLTAPAPALPLAAPQIELLERDDEADPDYRMKVRISSARNAEAMRIGIDTLAGVSRIEVGDQRYDFGLDPFKPGDGGDWLLFVLGGAGEAVELTLTLDQKHPVEFRVVDQTYGLPPVAGSVPQRPAGWIPNPSVDTDVTLVTATAYF
jgi:hypothetical protein